MLAKVVKENQRDWDSHIPKVLFAYRTALHESTSYSPYRVNFGRSPKLPVNVMLGRVPPPKEEEKKVCQNLLKRLAAYLRKHMMMYTKSWGKHTRKTK